VTGGLSGPAVKPVSLRCVWEVAQAVKIPVIGCGGITTGTDAIEYILAGASALELGTAVMTHGIGVYKEIADGIADYMEQNGFSEVKEMVGLAQNFENSGVDNACRISI
jgi:dihydroorotate dehydrogenase (NAD+) catalytic subunit